MTGTVLVLGGSGRFGRNAAEAFWNAGWRVRLFDRAHDDLQQASEGADVIVNGWNPAYTDWAEQVPQLTDQVIAAARHAGATVIVPGNVYVFGKDAPDSFGPGATHGATNPLGRIRIRMEQAYRESGVRVILLRAGDFLDTEASGNWFDLQMAPTLKNAVLTYPGTPDIPHAWAFLPDMARAAVALAERRDTLDWFTEVNFPGFTLSGRDMAELIGRGMGRAIRVKRMAWWPLRLASPFWPMGRKLLEMRYLWDKPHHLSPESFTALLPDFTPTDPQDALAAAVAPVLNERSDPPRQGRAVQGPATAA
ncbi:sugar nucleotide-binding protein [Mameliella sediminis]|uniref:sugar nucleotide-binding protein n=1 Tax=Mameliella sediminis TaxID=2836866 RepID=UPI001C45BA90|nr:sugar nucleotide-binding protein [Mameliella sediminis]MBV7395479.1 sugar nucleotide-binding protein [Mameliella sediminis]MBY6114182.1 sugar nucleotide-binding protein [Antarctobacter heliothermus]MBY6142470.1 sugar nucleotide-binding protein [Mameliella alba]MCA0953805.1 sugar nucleotide-binding protein [Mameliella alba]